MAYEIQRSCPLETRKYLWLIGLVLASIIVIQCFELPYRDSMFSLFSTGKDYSSVSNASETTTDGDVELKQIQSNPKNDLIPQVPKLDDGSLSAENLISESDNTMDTSRSTKVARGGSIISIAPETTNGVRYHFAVSPSVSSVADSPSRLDFSLVAPVVSPSAGNRNVVESASNSDLALVPPVISPSARNGIVVESPTSSDFALAPAPVISPSAVLREENEASMLSENLRNMSTLLKPAVSPSYNSSNSEVIETDRSPPQEPTSIRYSPPPPLKEMPEIPDKPVVSISEMNDMLLRSRVSSFSKSPLWPSTADEELEDVRFQIEHSAFVKDHPGLYAPIYRNVSKFVRSYELMEHKLKVYIYKDGNKPVFHQPRLSGIYASEGWFMKHLQASNQFLTSNPTEAHLFYLPFSSQLLVDYVYVKDSHTFDDIRKYLQSYLSTIKTKYAFWNRTDGSDHFLVACHDWAPIETRRDMANSIRALCNADINEGFQFGKDVSLPETFIHEPKNPMKQIIGGMLPSKRMILAFFAGQMHGYVRPILLKYWKDKDPDMKIVGQMHKGYEWHMKNSKYCICARGYEVNSPRVVEAILYECIPVIISDNFVPPFFEIFKWESFAVFVPEREIPNLKNILLSISEKRYVVMQKRVKMVRQHFLWHTTPVKYDIFHMILHSIWYNRVFRLQP